MEGCIPKEQAKWTLSHRCHTLHFLPPQSLPPAPSYRFRAQQDQHPVSFCQICETEESYFPVQHLALTLRWWDGLGPSLWSLLFYSYPILSYALNTNTLPYLCKYHLLPFPWFLLRKHLYLPISKHLLYCSCRFTSKICTSLTIQFSPELFIPPKG